MKRLFSSILLSLALCSSANVSGELRTRTISGKTYYVYTVKKGDTLDNLSKRLGMTRAEIIRFNPSSEDGLITGQWLIFPEGEYSSETAKKSPVQSGGSDLAVTYTVENNETIFGVAHRFGVSPETILAQNPQAASGLHRGMVLRISSGEAENGNRTSEIAAKPTTDRPDDKTEPQQIPRHETLTEPEQPAMQTAAATHTAIQDVAHDTAQDVAQTSVHVVPAVQEQQNEIAQTLDTLRIVIAMPLLSENEKVSKTANNYNEFYRGFLIGAQSMADDEKSQNHAAPISISVIDTSVSPFTSASLDGVQIAIVGEEESEINHAARIAEQGTYVLNVFNLRGEQSVSHPDVVHANIDQNRMFAHAIRNILDSYADYTPVVLNREGSRGEKQGFIDALREAVIDRSRNMYEINYSGKLTDEDLATLPSEEKYLFIPTSGSLNDFNHFAPLLKTMRDEDADPERLKVFGYPDWIAFRGEPRTQLCKLGASYYSRFADIENDVQAANVLNAYIGWYGSDATESVPNQAILGYDTARYIISGLRASGNVTDMLGSGYTYEGVQSVFRPVKADSKDSGYINDAIYIISCSDNGTIKSIIR